MCACLCVHISGTVSLGRLVNIGTLDMGKCVSMCKFLCACLWMCVWMQHMCTHICVRAHTCPSLVCVLACMLTQRCLIKVGCVQTPALFSRAGLWRPGLPAEQMQRLSMLRLPTSHALPATQVDRVLRLAKGDLGKAVELCLEGM